MVVIRQACSLALLSCTRVSSSTVADRAAVQPSQPDLLLHVVLAGSWSCHPTDRTAHLKCHSSHPALLAAGNVNVIVLLLSCFSQHSSVSECQLVRVFDDGLEALHEFSSSNARHDAVIAGQIAGHLLEHADASLLVCCHRGLAASNRQDCASACHMSAHAVKESFVSLTSVKPSYHNTKHLLLLRMGIA